MTEHGSGTSNPPSDGDLLTGLYARDIRSLEVLYDRYASFVYGLALRILTRREEAEEVVQDVFLQLWRGKVRYEPERGRFAAWLFSITRSRALDRLRSQKRNPLTEALAPDSPPTAPGNPESDAFASERRSVVTAALFALPALQKQALELCFYQGMSHSEIARRLGEPLGTVKSRIKMGMDKLKLSLRSYGSAG